MEEAKLIDIEKVFASKNARMLRFIPHFLINYLKRIVHQDEVNAIILSCKNKKDIDFAEAIINKFGAKIIIRGLDNVPGQGRFVFASNHPLGGLDGIVFVHAVGIKFKNIKFPVNDILMNLTNFKNIFLPINKHGATGKNAALMMDEAFASDAQMLMFPAGMVSRKNKGIIKDAQWKKTFVAKAIKHHRDIIPVHISGANSPFFYNIHNIRNMLGIKLNIEMLYLPDEMFKQYDKEISITFGKPIHWDDFKDDPTQQTADKLKEITYSLAKND